HCLFPLQDKESIFDVSKYVYKPVSDISGRTRSGVLKGFDHLLYLVDNWDGSETIPKAPSYS
uniref:Uncharacterized protein n=1 Tax=Oncorhynchus mykiss TaxID=8022 RepID=A0A8K9VCJ3_ONCMY